MAADIDSLPDIFEKAIAACRKGRPEDRRAELDMGGADRIARIIGRIWTGVERVRGRRPERSIAC